MNTAVILGVGPRRGLGAALCRRFADEGLHVIVAGRTAASLNEVVAGIRAAGGSAEAALVDATDESAVTALFEGIDTPVDLAIYNAGNNFPGPIAGMDAAYFEQAWRVCCFGGFLFGRQALRHMLPGGRGTVLFTGASASLRGRARFGAFTAAKGGLRQMAQAMAKEYGPAGIHVGHVVVDGAIAGDKIIDAFPDYAARLGESGMIDLDGIADGYLYLYRQPPRAWTFELDVRTSVERW